MRTTLATLWLAATLALCHPAGGGEEAAELASLRERCQRLAAERDALKEQVEEVRENLASLASVAFERGDLDVARAVARNAVRLGESSPEMLYVIAYASAAAGDDAEAVTWYERALEGLDSEDGAQVGLRVKCLSNCAAALLRLGEAERAVGLLERAVALDAEFAPAHFNLGLAYARHLDRPAEAVQALRRHVALGGARSETARNLIRELQERAAEPGPPPAP